MLRRSTPFDNSEYFFVTDSIASPVSSIEDASSTNFEPREEREEVLLLYSVAISEIALCASSPFSIAISCLWINSSALVIMNWRAALAAHITATFAKVDKSIPPTDLMADPALDVIFAKVDVDWPVDSRYDL